MIRSQKVKKTICAIIAAVLIVSMLLGAVVTMTGCGTTPLEKEMLDAMNNEQEIKISVHSEDAKADREQIEWVELDQLETHENIRKVWDDKLQIVRFDTSSKNGSIFVDLEGNWAGNNTLYNAFQNKYFTSNFWSAGRIKSDLSQAAIDEFSDINDSTTGIIASVNAYYNLIPNNKDKTSGLFEPLSRAEAMSIIYRADTPVLFAESKNDFTKVVGNNDYNIYAQNLTDDDYLDYNNGSLNYDTYNSLISQAEVMYMIANRYFKDELESVNIKDKPFSDCSNAGNIAEDKGFKDKHGWQAYELEYSLLNPKGGAPEDLYKAMLVCYNNGIVYSDSYWNQSINAGELITMLISAYSVLGKQDNYHLNAKIGENAGNSLVAVVEEDETEEPEVIEEEIGSSTIEHVRDVTDLDDLINVYGSELQLSDAELQEVRDSVDGFTFEPYDKWMQVDFCSYLNIRVGPSTDFKIIKSIPTGTKVHIVARCIENGWYRVIADGKIAYQCGVYFSDFEGADELLKTEN